MNWTRRSAVPEALEAAALQADSEMVETSLSGRPRFVTTIRGCHPGRFSFSMAFSRERDRSGGSRDAPFLRGLRMVWQGTRMAFPSFGIS